MYYKLDEIDMEIIKKAEEIISEDYDIEDNFIKVEYLVELIEDLLAEIEKLEKKIANIKQDIEDNYKPYTNRELYGDIEIGRAHV